MKAPLLRHPFTQLVAAYSMTSLCVLSASAQYLPGVDHNEVAYPVEQIVSYSVGSPYTILGSQVLSSFTLDPQDLGCQQGNPQRCRVSLMSGLDLRVGTTSAVSRISADTGRFVYRISASTSGGNVTGIDFQTDHAVTGIDYSSRTVVDSVTYNTQTETLNLWPTIRYNPNATYFRGAFQGPTIRNRAISTTYISDVDRLGNEKEAEASVGFTKSRATGKDVDVAANLFCLKNGHLGAFSHTAVDVTLNDVGSLPQRIIKSDVVVPFERTLKSPGLGASENMATRDDVPAKGKFNVYETIKCATACHKDDVACKNGRPVVTNIGQGSDGSVRWFWLILSGVDTSEISKGRVELLLGTDASESTPIEAAAPASITTPEVSDGGVTFAVVVPVGLNKTLEEGNLRMRFVNTSRGTTSDIARIPGVNGTAGSARPSSAVVVQAMQGFITARQHILDESVRVTNAINAGTSRR